MLLRLRVELPDRPGSLGQVARTLGVAGADIVQVVVLERIGGRAVDDFTVMWPASGPVDRVLAGMMAVPGVRIDGVWRATELPEPSGREVAVLAQIAGNPGRGLMTTVDAVPGMFAAEWAAVAAVGDDWASTTGTVDLVCTSWQTPAVPPIPDLSPLRPRALTAPDGTHLAVAPFRRGGLVLVAARGGPEAPDGDALFPPAFHRGEVERLAQLVDAVGAVLGTGLETAAANGRRDAVAGGRSA